MEGREERIDWEVDGGQDVGDRRKLSVGGFKCRASDVRMLRARLDVHRFGIGLRGRRFSVPRFDELRT